MSEFFYLNSPLVKLYFFKDTAMFIYTPPHYLSILFLQFSYSRVIQLWSHFSVFFYLNSPLVKVYFFEDTAMFIYTPPNYLSILFLQFSYSRVIQFWSHFSVFFYFNCLLKILLCSFISLLVFDFLIVGSYNFDHIFQNAFGQHLEKIHLCICQVL